MHPTVAPLKLVMFKFRKNIVPELCAKFLQIIKLPSLLEKFKESFINTKIKKLGYIDEDMNKFWRHDTQHNGIENNETQQMRLTCDTQHK